MVTPRTKEDLTGRLLATFKQLISEGTLAPGARLPAEREMASSLRVSRGSLRQVLKMLEIMGVVSQRVGDGTYLNAAAPSMLAEPMELLILLDGISFDELMDARLIVEPELAARAAARATPVHLAALRAALSAMEESGDDHARFVDEDLRFHRTIFQMAENRVCSVMFSIVHQSLHKLMDLTSRMVDSGHTLKLHHRIYTAIRKRDPEEARGRMFAHLTDAKALLTRVSEEQAGGKLEARFSSLAIGNSAVASGRKPRLA
jgi:GntR family transcriptional regulator, transcriptional repressor for pyruvate dehydrogenase complex